jgi:uncharacterized membrane protein
MADAARTVGADRARTAALLMLGALAAVALTATLREAASPVSLGLLALFLLVPLLLPLPGLLQGRRRTYAWCTLCLTPHLVYALTEVVANPAVRPLALAMIALVFALTVALVAYLRLTRKGDRG